MADRKLCKRCDCDLPLSHFRPDLRYRDGYGSWCVNCHRARNSEWAKQNRSRLTIKASVWREKNRDLARASNVKHKRTHAEHLKPLHAAWAKANKDKRRASWAKHKAAKLRATPPWADLEAIKAVYRRAIELEAATAIRMHVDHIVPLQHPLVCGLHVPANLQVLTGPENEGKKNRFEPYEIALSRPDLFVERPAPAVQEAMF